MGYVEVAHTMEQTFGTGGAGGEVAYDGCDCGWTER
jgi:hypothetical protein